MTTAADVRAIPSAPGYFVSADGRVFSEMKGARRELTRFDRRTRRGQPSGYLSVQLGRGRPAYVHRLVLEAFVGPAPSAEHEGCHGNGDRSDNRIENLRWDTPAGNTVDRYLHGRIPRGSEHPNWKGGDGAPLFEHMNEGHAFSDLLSAAE